MSPIQKVMIVIGVVAATTASMYVLTSDGPWKPRRARAAEFYKTYISSSLRDPRAVLIGLLMMSIAVAAAITGDWSTMAKALALGIPLAWLAWLQIFRQGP